MSNFDLLVALELKFDWLLRPNGFELKKSVQFCQAWSEDHMWHVSRGLDKICDSSHILKFFHISQDAGKSIMRKITSYGALNSAWPKDSNYTLVVKIGWMGQKL